MSTILSMKSKRFRREAGIALLTTLLLLFLMSSLLVGFSLLLISNQQLAGSNNDDVQAFYGAEAGMEQLTAGLGNLFTQTYAPSISQINTLETSPPSIPGISYVTADGHSGYVITPTALDSNGNPAPQVSTIKSGPYVGMNALITAYTLTVNARTSLGREVKLQRTTQTVGIPMFQFGVFSDMDLTFHAGPDFTFGGRTHTNGNLFLAEGDGSTLTMKDKVDTYKDVIRTNMANGWPTSSGYTGTVNITTNPGSTSYRALKSNEGSLTGGAGCSSCANTSWPTISTGNAPANYNSNLVNGPGSQYPKYATGARQLNLGIVTVGGGTTQSVDIIRRPVAGESSTVTGERYWAQASLRIMLSDDPNDIMGLSGTNCMDTSVQPFDLSVLAQPVANWPTSGWPATLKTNLTSAGLPVLPLAASGAAAGAAAYNSMDGYWLPSGYPVIKGFIKIEAQTAYGSPCGTWKDVTMEILSLGYVGRNINPVSQSLATNIMNPQWRTIVISGNTQTDPLSNGSTHYYTTSNSGATPPNQLTLNAGYGYPLPIPPGAQMGSQMATAMGAGTFTGQAGTCQDPHPNAIIRLERIRDNPSSLYTAYWKNTSGVWVNYVASGIQSNPSNEPPKAPVAVVCGVDPATGKLPIIADQTGSTAVWTPQPFDFWPTTIFDTREGELRETVINSGAYQNLPTLNGTMHYIEIDAKNLANWFAGNIGTSGHSTMDQNVAPNDFVVYVSDRRGNYASSKTWSTSWPPVSPSGHETGEYGWNDVANGTVANGCQNGTLDPGEDLDGVSQLFTYGANSTDTNFVMGAGAAESTLYSLSGSNITGALSTAYPKYGFYNNLLTSSALLANNFCAAPSYSASIWPLTFAASSNAARENPPIFFRRAVKIVNGKLLTALGTCPSGVYCGLTISAENPVYVQGDYNANSANGGFNDPHVATSVAGDAVTLLSNNWNDINSFSFAEYCLTGGSCTVQNRNAINTYWRTAVIAGKGINFPYWGTSGDNGSDGGVHNFLRYIEDWSNQTLYYTGSLISMYYNRQATGIFKCCSTVYAPPTRGYQFDVDFLNPTLLPPRTPLFRDTNTTGWTRLMLPSQ